MMKVLAMVAVSSSRPSGYPWRELYPSFFVHLLQSLEVYLVHVYEIKLSNCADNCAERALIINPVARQNFPDEFKGVVNEVVDFSSGIHAKREHDLTCSFAETHKCEVHHITCAPKFVVVDEIERYHPP